MKKIKKHSLTLIEVLAVLGITALLIGLFVPAFSRMMENNQVDQMASNFKTGMEIAQAKAIAARRYVAMILPTKYSDFTAGTNELRSYCNGGYRLAFVKKDGGSWIFDGWVPGSAWSNMPDGAMLVGIRTGRNWLDDDKKFKPLAGPTGVILRNEATNNLNGVELLKYIKAEDCEDPDVKALGDELSSGGNSENAGKRENMRGIVFSPFGGVDSGEEPLLLFFTEAKIDSNTYSYANTDNFIILKLNPITGKASYLPMEDGDDD